MIIGVSGCGTVNKGSELMLLAVREHYQPLKGRIRLAVEPLFGSYEKRTAYDLYHKLPATRLGRSALATWLMPPSFRNAYGLVAESDVDGVLDISGFRLGDQHGPRPCERMAQNVRRWKRRGKPVILLPQAFGPFSSPRIRAALQVVLDNADLAFARDKASFQHVSESAGENGRLRLAPDFTCLVEGRLRPDYPLDRRRACIVPNELMIELTNESAGRAYITFLATCIRILWQRGLEPFILLHSTVGDPNLAERVCETAGRDTEVVRESDPIVLKGILGNTEVVVGSRFHALASALSQAVPCLATGWSHKYASLMADYDCADCNVEPVLSEGEIDAKLGRLIEEPERSDLLSRLTAAAERQRRRVCEMWTEVDRVLGVTAK